MNPPGTRALLNSKVTHNNMVGLKDEDILCAGSRLSWDDFHEACSKSSVEDGLECPVCWEGFNHGNNLPYVLWCGHSLCKSCLMGLQCASVKLPVVPVQLPLFVSCPWCQFLSCRLLWKGKLKYPCKNFFLLWLVESLKGETKQSREFSRSEDKLCKGTASSQHAYESQGSRRVLHNDYQGPLSSYTVRHFTETMGNHDFAAQQPSDTFFVHRWFKKVTNLCAQLLAKCMLLLLAMLILFCVLPFSTIILMVYFAATLIFAFPSFLVVYFAFPSLSWLLREIAT